MSSLPKEQQSVAGGIFQTVTRLTMTVGYGVATAVFNTVSKHSNLGSYYKGDTETQPYAATFWFSTACAGLSLLLVPFLTIGTQGGKEKDKAEKV